MNPTATINCTRFPPFAIKLADVYAVLRSKDLKVQLAQRDVKWRRVFYPSIVEGDADC